ncbi:MAG: metallophosphoesterase [Gemmatimonadota bacterium]
MRPFSRATPVLLALSLAAPPATLAQPAERVTAPIRVSGQVFEDTNGNGRRDPGESGLAGAMVSDQVSVTTTDADGRFAIAASGYGFVFLAQPDGYLVRGALWRSARANTPVDFPVRRLDQGSSFRFVHASDTHISEQSLPRMRRLRAMVDSIQPDFVLITGDLVRDALLVPESEATGYYELLMRELAQFSVPVFTTLGNHEIFGIERHQSLVPASHPLYGKRMYRSYLGPNYYAFTWGGVHFLSLDTVDYLEMEYFGHVDPVQLEWLRQDLARLPVGMPVVTFNHIPLTSPSPVLFGIREEPPAPSLIRIDGKLYLRHAVHNAEAVLKVLGGRLELALGGHFHLRETMTFETASGPIRLHQTAAVTGPAFGEGPFGHRSGITLYQVRRGQVDDGQFIPLDPDRAP